MTRPTLLLTVLVALGSAGCSEIDPGVEEVPDSERIVGTWTAASANVRLEGVPFGIPVSDLANSEDEHTFTFGTDRTFRFRFDPAAGRRVTISYQGRTYASFPLDQTVALSGTYTVDDSADEITFSTVAGQTVDDFQMGYGFGLSGTQLELIAEDPETLARLFGLADADAAQLAEFVTGGSITYSQDD